MQQRVRDRMEDLEFMLETGASFEEALQRLGVSRQALETWCIRHGVPHLYQKLLHRSHPCTQACRLSKYGRYRRNA